LLRQSYQVLQCQLSRQCSPTTIGNLFAPAVPSFAERWRAFVAQPWYESDPSYTVSELARHLVDEVAAGRTGELPAILHRARRLLAGASDELYDLATIGLLEDIVHEADRRA
jgi:hypothetical protein